MAEPKPGLVNGDIVKDLLDLCDDWFVDAMVQPYAGANRECQYCGCIDGKTGHIEVNCPVVKYRTICDKHSKYLRK